MRARVAALLLMAGTAVSAPAQAQFTHVVNIGLGAGTVRLRNAPANGQNEVLAGAIVSGSGALTVGPAALEVFYMQGNLTPDSGSAAPRDLVDGSLLLAVYPVRWLALKGGAHLRSYVAAGTERWASYELRIRGEDDIIGGILRAHVELFHSVSASVNVPGLKADGLAGGEAGLVLRPPRTPLWFRLRYAVDQVRSAGGGTETLDGIAIAIGIGGR